MHLGSSGFLKDRLTSLQDEGVVNLLEATTDKTHWTTSYSQLRKCNKIPTNKFLSWSDFSLLTKDNAT